MAKLSSEVQEAIKKTLPYNIATASADGVPNLIYITYLKILDDETVVIADNKFDKTRKNLNSNPFISFTVLDKDTNKAYQIKGKVECVTKGKKYDDVVEWVHIQHPQMTPKAAFYVSVQEVYAGAEKLA
ncbi:pyridoxamine 5'-phosphate oxidase [Oceanispirochaeta crateris]|uniref:Pyridoxamine 5'-phosphate oxidase n=1 Tax=Oceanispirochaeta crateris TaxID=2518645 RepID=A0A5C1QK75_9SPIO|nr:pyridoxamine 5'-phosphate oxidase family protein [Oceanispirochaeta crateris]QEN07589.1 pyridoxamine 5'-phosphate oxidase [Oceanispirochaeta crateris]